jgi:hypothetical protein
LSFTFFTDRDLGKKFPAFLSAAGLKVERHQDHFADDASDEEWLEAIGKKGWVAVTHNLRIRYMPNELDAVIRHRVSLLIVIGKAPYHELAASFVETMPRIEAFLARHTPPFIAKTYRPSPSETARGEAAGRVELWYPKGN